MTDRPRQPEISPGALSRDMTPVSRSVLSYGIAAVAVVAAVVTLVALLMCQRREPAPGRDAFSALQEADPEDQPDTRPQIEVLNGCGVSGIAARVQEFLIARGYDVVNVENAGGFDYPESIVIDRGGDAGIARRVARALGTGNVIRQVRPDLMLQVTVILGADYRALGPFAGEGP